VLSGGERNRYALLKMLLHPANFLLLDEPTNHLDMRAKDVLLEALSKYTGTVVFVSHDRYFIDKLATRVFEIGDGKVEIYPGNYEDYLWRKQGGPAQLGSAGTLAASRGGVPPPSVQPLQDAVVAKRLNPMKRKQMEDRLTALERAISRAEETIADCESALQTFVSNEETQRHTQTLQQARAELQSLLSEWEELGQALEV